MTRMIFIRHGESMGNFHQVFYGHTDGELTDKGRAQAAKTAEYLKDMHIDVTYTSDLCRAHETAKIISAPHNVEVIPDKGLRELYAGDWEGVPNPYLKENNPEYTVWLNDFPNAHPQNGESIRELFERISKTVWRIAAENDGKTVLIATHATPMRLLTCEWCCAPIEKAQQIGWVKNASVSIVDYDTENHKTFVQLYDEASFMGDISTALPKGV